MATKQAEQFSVAATPEPPNGGLAAWAGVFASFLLFVTTWGFSTTFGAFQSYYQSDTLSSSAPSRIAWVGTIQAFCLISTGVIAGPLFDRGYLHHLMIAGCFLTTLRLMMLSLSTEYYQIFLSQGICSGLGSGLIYVPALSLVSTCFTTRRGLAVGLVTSGASIGGVIFPIIFIRLQPRIGFPWTAPLRQIIHWHAMKEWHFNAYGIANFLIFMAYFIPIFYVPTFAQTALHTSTALSFYMVLILNAGSAIGRIWVVPADLLSRSKPHSPGQRYCLGCVPLRMDGYPLGCQLCGLLCFLWDILRSVDLGQSAGHRSPDCLADPLGHWHPRMGMQWFATSLGVLIGAPIGGILEGHGGSDGFLGLQLFSAVGMIVGAVFLLVPTMAIWRYEKP